MEPLSKFIFGDWILKCHSYDLLNMQNVWASFFKVPYSSIVVAFLWHGGSKVFGSA